MKNRSSLSAASLHALLRRVHVNGMIDECLLQVKDESSYVSAIDNTNSILLIANQPTPGLEDGIFGISQIPLLIRFLSSCEDDDLRYSISEDKKHLTLNKKGHGRIQILLLEPELVGTRLEDEPDFPKLIKKYAHKVKLKKGFIEDALYYTSIIDNQSVEFVAKGNRLMFASKTSEHQQFELPVCAIEEEQDICTRLYSDQIRNVLSIIELTEQSCLYIANDFPIIIAQDAENAWALTPVIS